MQPTVPTEVISIETPASFEAAAARAAQLLQAGEVVAVPTETVYGLAANALNPAAVQKIYTAKGRPAHNPIIVHVSSIEMARECAAEWPDAAGTLARHFWPGPLTIVLPKSDRIPSIVTADGPTVGIRWPLHPFMQKVIHLCGFPLAAPSANPANEISPTTAAHVLQGLRGKVPLVIDAGSSSVGIKSTVVEVRSRGATQVRILRPGMISAAQIQAVLHSADLVESGVSDPEEGTLKSPGMLKKHYSPRARLKVVRWQDDSQLQALARESGLQFESIHVLAHDKIPRGHTSDSFGRVALIPHDPEAYARALYAELHHSDALGAKLILVEELPFAPEWDGIRDRLARASAEG